MARSFFGIAALTTSMLLHPGVLLAETLAFAYTAEQVGGPLVNGPGVASGIFGYDLAAPDQVPDVPDFGRYEAFWSVAVTGGPQAGGSFSVTDIIFIADFDNPPADIIQVLNTVHPDPGFSTLTLTSEVDVFSGDALPTSIAFSDYTGSREFNLSLRDRDLGLSGTSGTFYQITSLSQVPLPASLVLALSAFGLLLGIRRSA